MIRRKELIALRARLEVLFPPNMPGDAAEVVGILARRLDAIEDALGMVGRDVPPHVHMRGDSITMKDGHAVHRCVVPNCAALLRTVPGATWIEPPPEDG